jgi:diguanylate cyclase (GGDEF)-like protein/PAS domain S-box-containing protein
VAGGKRRSVTIMRLSFSNRLQLLTIVGSSVLACVFYWTSLVHTQSLELERARQRMELRSVQLNESVSQQLDATLRGVDVALRHLRSVHLHSPRDFDQAVQDVLATYPKGMMQYVTVIGADGYLKYVSNQPDQGSDNRYFGDREHFLVHARSSADQLFVSAPFVGRMVNVPLVQVTRPIWDGKLFRGVIGIALRPDYLSSQLRSLRIDPEDLLVVVRLDGSIIARSHHLEEALTTKLPPDRPFLKGKAGASGVFRSSSTVDKVPLLFSWQRLAQWPLITVAAVNEDAELASLSQRLAQERQHTLLTMALVVAFSTVVAALMLRIQRKNDELAQSEGRHRALFENSKIPMLLVDPAGGSIVDANQAAAAFYGYGCERLRQMQITDINQMPQAELVVEMAQAQAEKRDCFYFSHRLCSGEIRQVEVHSGPLTVDGRRLLYSFIHDVTDRKAAEDKLRTRDLALKSISQGVLIADAQQRILWVNDAFETVTGYVLKDVLGQNCRFLQGPLSDAGTAEAIRNALRELREFSGEILNYRRDGTTFWNDLTISPVRNEQGVVTHFVGVTRDVTERKQAQEKLQLAASVFSHAREGILITSADARIIDVNQTFTRITGYGRDEVLGKNPRLLNSGRQGKEFYVAMWRDLQVQGHWYGEVWNRRKSGEIYAQMQTISAVRDASGTITQYVALFSDITSLKENESKLERSAHYDALTGLPNRVLLADRLHQSMAQAQRRGHQLAVVYLDLDGFKSINDHHGHDAGDQLLMTLSKRMKLALREGDTLARIGGDEFVAVLLDLDGVQASVPMLSRLLGAASQPVKIGDVLAQVTASLGVTFYPQGEDVDADLLLRQSDQAMYQAKLSGKNRYHVFDAEQDRHVRGQHETLDDIHRALVEHEFVLYYQPKVNMRSASLFGVEALIRWQHPVKGLLLPAAFLPVIEDHPLAIEVGEWVIDTALNQISAWRSSGLDLQVSVNVGARQLQQAEFVDRLRAILARHPDLRAEYLEIEILETSALEEIGQVSNVIDACREMGVSFALDDFGTGYSSLAYLKHLPVAALKIDQSFVRDMLDDPDDLAILEGVIGLAAAFGRQVIAEGVETPAHGAMLLQLECELAQGYGIAHPMPAQAIAAWAASWRADPSWRDLPPVNRDDLPLLFAAIEHRAWLGAVSAYLSGAHDSPPPVDLHQCRFGQWLDAEGLTRYGLHPSFASIDFLHRRTHAVAASLCELRSQGKGDQACAGLDELFGSQGAMLGQLEALLYERVPQGRDDTAFRPAVDPDRVSSVV